MKKSLKIAAALIGAGVLMLCMVGCGKQNDSEDFDYTRADVLRKRIYDADTAIGDWSMEDGKGYTDKEIDTEAPVFRMYVNPFATDEIIDRYVANVDIMDKFLAESKEYRKLCRKGKAYIVTFECEGEVLESVKLTGKVNLEEVKASLKEALVTPSSQAQARIDEFESYLSKVEGLNKDSSGQYYFILDSHNLTESAESIMKKADEIKEKYPFSEDDMQNWVDSFNTIGTPGGTYNVYLDDYNTTPIMGVGARFSMSSVWIYNMAYREVMPKEYYSKEPLSTYYTVGYYEDKEWRLSGGVCDDPVEVEGEELPQAIPVTKEEVQDCLYKLYDQIISEHEEHKIVIDEDIFFSGDIPLSDQGNDVMIYDIYVFAPAGTRCTKEEFLELIDKESKILTLDEFQLEDMPKEEY